MILFWIVVWIVIIEIIYIRGIWKNEHKATTIRNLHSRIAGDIQLFGAQPLGRKNVRGKKVGGASKDSRRENEFRICADKEGKHYVYPNRNPSDGP